MLRWMGTLPCFFTIWQRGTIFMTFCFLPSIMKPFQNGIHRLRKEFAPGGANSILKQWDQLRKDENWEWKSCFSLKVFSFPWNIIWCITDRCDAGNDCHSNALCISSATSYTCQCFTNHRDINGDGRLCLGKSVKLTVLKISKYRKNSKIWDTSNNCHDCPKNWKIWCNIALMHPKDADGMANSVDPDQTASSEAVWSWSALFAETYLSQYIEFLWYLP